MRQSSLPILLLAVVVCVGGLLGVLALSKGESSATESGLIINEVMSSNKGSVPDENGKFPAWVELYNPSDTDIDISGFGLSNGKKNIVKWNFPSGTVIRKGGYLVVFCSGNADDGSLHASFTLSSDDAMVLTGAQTNPIDSLQLVPVAPNHTLGRNDKGEWVEFEHPSPGFPNTDEGAQAYREGLKTGAQDNGVRINELMASNSTALPGPFGDYPDWVELYNTSDEAVDLSGCGLSDKSDRPMKWIFPDGVTINPHEYLMVYCSKRDGIIEGELHTSFALSAYQEELVLSNSMGETVDSVSFSKLNTDSSYARTPDGTGEFKITQNPTPASSNE